MSDDVPRSHVSGNAHLGEPIDTQCEMTGVFVTPDERTMVVGIQQPGEPVSVWPDPASPTAFSGCRLQADGWLGPRPRSACLVIAKGDGGPIGI